MHTNYYKDYLLDDIHTWQLSTIQTSMLDACLYMVDNKCTIRYAAENCGLSKSYLHWWIHHKLPKTSRELYSVVIKVLRFNETKKIGGVNFEKYRKRTRRTGSRR